MYRAMTYAQEMQAKYPDRPYVTRPSWELRNMVKALSMMSWLNTPEDEQRKAEAQAELKARRSRK